MNLRTVLTAGLLWTAAKGGAAQGPACTPLDSMAPWSRVNRAWSREAGQTWTNDSLRKVLVGMALRDQAARADFGARSLDSAYARELNALDATLASEMTLVLKRFGLPTRSMVGAAGSDAAMLIVQHNEQLQPSVLALAKAAPAGQISPQALAMLEDRVLVHEGKPQRFGTQFTFAPNGTLRFAPNADLDGLAARRSRSGLPPMDQYVCMMEEGGLKIDRATLPPVAKPRDQ